MRFLIKHPQVLTNIMLMRTKSCLVPAVWVVGLCVSVRAATYSGNGNTGFGGTIGNGSLSLTDDGTTVSGTVTKGAAGAFDNALVLYVDSVPSGFTNTSGFNDGGDGLRRAISGFDGGANRSVLTMTAGFGADYAIALGPAPSESFGGLWQLSNGGGNNSLGFISSVNLNPTGDASSPSYTFSFDVSQIGLSPNSGQSIRLLGTYISNTGFRSDEALAGDVSGTQGYNPFTGTADPSYTIVPEPSTGLLFGLVAFCAVLGRRRRN